jgi:hypothetical protein
MRTPLRDAHPRPGSRGWRAEKRKILWLPSEDAQAPRGAPRRRLCEHRAPLSPEIRCFGSSASSWRGLASGPGGEPRRRPSARLANRTRRRRASSRLHDASRSAPRWTRWMQHRGSFGGEDNFKLVGTRRLPGHDKRSVQNAVSATQLPLPIGPWVGGASVARLGPSRFGSRVCSAWVSGSPELPRSAPAGPCAPSARLSFSRPWRAQTIRAASLP